MKNKKLKKLVLIFGRTGMLSRAIALFIIISFYVSGGLTFENDVHNLIV